MNPQPNDPLVDLKQELNQASEQAQIPAWHSEVLDGRERRLRQGKSVLNDWPEVKRRIREQLGKP